MTSINAIVEFLNAESALIELKENAREVIITRPMVIAKAQSGEVTFCGRTAKNPQALLAQTHASLLIVDRNLILDQASLTQAGVQALILSDNARLDFFKVVENFFAPPRAQGIHPTVIIGQNVNRGVNVTIGAYSIIGNNVSFGDYTEIHEHVVIKDNTIIGNHCKIFAHCVIGEEGFAFETDSEGKTKRFPHIGNVIIGSHVEIGSFTTVHKGGLDSTIIKDHVKIDDQSFISHNVFVGENSTITCAKIGGSTILGKNVYVGSNATIIDRITIGDDCLIGIGAVVIKNVSPNKIVVGNPARILRDRFPPK